MRTYTLALAAALALVPGCSKDDKAKAETPPASDPVAKPTEPAPEQPKEKPPVPAELPANFASIWDAPIHTLDGKPTTLAAFKGKSLMVVNVASKCGLTPQYTQLEALQKQYESKGFTVVGMPCNQFGGQEPGTAEEIQEFCSTTYGVTFPMMEKIDVNGGGRHAIYQELTQVADAGGHTGDIRWNFEKFVISADGTKVNRFDPRTTPDDPKVIAAIEAGLPN